MKTCVISPNRSGCVSILDCGVTYLATYINKRTPHKASVWDYTFKRKHWERYLAEKYEREKPDVMAVTYTTLYRPYVEDTVAFIRGRLSKDVPVVIGGIHPTLKPDESIRIPGADYVIRGEGEETFAELLGALEGGSRDFSGVKGLTWKTPDGQIVHNDPRAWIKDINSLPFPDYDLWEDIEKYFYFLSQLWLIGSRGCPYNCTNCEELPLRKSCPGSRHRVRDPRNYVDEIAWHYEKYKNINFRMAHPFDPVFPINREWTRRFCQEYVKSGLSGKLPFSIFSRGDSFYIQSPVKGGFDEERLQWLAEAGCREIRIGIEAGSERMRNEIHKKMVTDNQLIESFRNFKKYKMITIGYNMLGGPTETKEELIQTFRMNLRLNPNKPIFFIYQELTHDMKELGLESHDETAAPEDSPGAKRRKEQDRATIQFGEPLASPHYSKTWIMLFQLLCYSYFVGKRIGWGLLTQRHRFVINFVRFMLRGRREGANMKIVFAYFLSSSGDNLFS